MTTKVTSKLARDSCGLQQSLAPTSRRNCKKLQQSLEKSSESGRALPRRAAAPIYHKDRKKLLSLRRSQKEKKKLSGKTWHIPEQPNLELITGSACTALGTAPPRASWECSQSQMVVVGHSKNPSSAEEKLIFSRGSQIFLKGPHRAPVYVSSSKLKCIRNMLNKENLVHLVSKQLAKNLLPL